MTQANQTQTTCLVATAQIADACIRLKVPYRVAPPGIMAIVPVETMVYGAAVPVRHYGSVDIFLEVLEATSQKGILVIDNGGRQDEACIGDLGVLELKHAGILAVVIWGLHRDTRDLQEIALPVFSYGAYPVGPCRLDERDADAMTHARFGDFVVSNDDTVFADRDGVMFVATQHVQDVVCLAQNIYTSERNQAQAAAAGVSLREQFQFQNYLERRHRDKGYTFRQHLSAISKAIEE